jgi:hypothetical protein
LSENYPPLVPPQKQQLDTAKIKRLMVAAAAMATELRPITEDEDTSLDPKNKLVAKLSLSLFDALEAVIESGIMPLSSTAQTAGNRPALRSVSGAGASGGGLKVPPPPPPKPALPAGLKELREGLERADRGV